MAYVEQATLILDASQAEREANQINNTLRQLFTKRQIGIDTSNLTRAAAEANKVTQAIVRMQSAGRTRMAGSVPLVGSGQLQTLSAIERQAHEARTAVSTIGATVDVSGLQRAHSMLEQITREAREARSITSGFGRDATSRTRMPPQQQTQTSTAKNFGDVAGRTMMNYGKGFGIGAGTALKFALAGTALAAGARVGRSAGEGILNADDVRAQVRATGASPEQQAMLQAAAQRATAVYKGAPTASIIDASIEQFGFLNSQLEKNLITTTEYATRLDALTMRTAKNTQILSTGLKDANAGAEQARQLEKSLAIMGEQVDPAQAEKFSQGIIRAVIASGYDMKPSEIKRSLQQMKGPLANQVSEVGIARLSLIRDEGGRAATAAVRMFYDGMTSQGINKEDMATQRNRGLRSTSGVSTIDTAKWADPTELVLTDLMPRVEAEMRKLYKTEAEFNEKMKDSVAVSSVLQDKFGLTPSRAEFPTMAIVQRDQLAIEKQRIEQVKPEALTTDTLRISLADVEAKFQDMSASLTQQALPAIQKGADFLSDTFQRIGKEGPSVTDWATIAAGTTGIGLASGMIGMMDPATRPLAAAGISLQASAVALTASATALGTAAIAQGASAAGKTGALAAVGRFLTNPATALTAIGLSLSGSTADNAYTSASEAERQKMRDDARKTTEYINSMAALKEGGEGRTDRERTTPEQIQSIQADNLLIKNLGALEREDRIRKERMMMPDNVGAGPTVPVTPVPAAGEIPAVQQMLRGMDQFAPTSFQQTFNTGASDINTALVTGGTSVASTVSAAAPNWGAQIGAGLAALMPSMGAALGAAAAAQINSAKVSVAMTSGVDTGGQEMVG